MNLNKEWLEEKSKLEEGFDIIAGVPELNPEIFVETAGRSELYEITTDGKTVWINDAFKCLARFSSKSYEINCQEGFVRLKISLHKSIRFGIEDLDKTSWNEFVKDVKFILKINLSDHYMPERFKNE